MLKLFPTPKTPKTLLTLIKVDHPEPHHILDLNLAPFPIPNLPIINSPVLSLLPFENELTKRLHSLCPKQINHIHKPKPQSLQLLAIPNLPHRRLRIHIDSSQILINKHLALIVNLQSSKSQIHSRPLCMILRPQLNGSGIIFFSLSTFPNKCWRKLYELSIKNQCIA